MCSHKDMPLAKAGGMSLWRVLCQFLALLGLLAGPGAAFVVAEALAILALGRKTVDLPGLTHQAAGATILRSFAFVVHRSPSAEPRYTGLLLK
jgi:hypothetical protein